MIDKRKKVNKIVLIKEKNPTRRKSSTLPEGYKEFVIRLKSKIQTSQIKAVTSVNRELIRLYWDIGKDIVERQEIDGWGSKVIEKIAADLQNEFPGVSGFSPRNVWRMRAFYQAYEGLGKFLPQAVAEIAENSLPLALESIPWGHNIVLLEKLKSAKERLWYAKMTVSEGWSRNGLLDAIKTLWYKRYGRAITNFNERLPNPQSSLARDTLKDPYNFDFLELTREHVEKDVEEGLLKHVEKFMRELGQGFSFVGKQVHLQVSDKDFYIDLLFYHLKLRCFVVIELKATDFKPEHAGKMNFYLSAVDDMMKHPSDNPTIGILICKKKDNYIAEYALRDIHKPMGVAEYETKIVSSLPKKLEGQLPTIESIEAELSAIPVFEVKKKKAKKKSAK
jgi:predicted nuclease of restriction endonuclease-like (RecB) superfamily